jgi:hypothetical protein
LPFEPTKLVRVPREYLPYQELCCRMAFLPKITHAHARKRKDNRENTRIKLARREFARCCVSARKFYEILSPQFEIELRIPSENQFPRYFLTAF